MRVNPEELLGLAMREYDALRAEIVSTVERQYSLANWGISTAALVIAALVGGWHSFVGHPMALTTTLVLVVPGLITAYAVAWSHTITKINQLGERLFVIEENVARMIDSDSIREAYAIPATTELDPHRYLLGWEHLLWKRGENLRVQTTIRVVRVVLAAVYVLLIGVTVIILTTMRQTSSIAVMAIITTAITVWGAAWYALFHYLRRSSMLSNGRTPR